MIKILLPTPKKGSHRWIYYQVGICALIVVFLIWIFASLQNTDNGDLDFEMHLRYKRQNVPHVEGNAMPAKSRGSKGRIPGVQVSQRRTAGLR